MRYRSVFRKSLLFSALSLLLSAPTAWSDSAPVSVSSVQSAANTGAATTSIPIDVPPGRKGIQPNLALTYNSNSPNGWLGVGWSLDMGSIQRSTKRGVSYSANDYVANGAELVARGDWGSNYYGAKTEGAFSKYYFDSSTGGWVVTTKDGTKYYYGTTAASRQDNAMGVFKWCLDKVVDTNGNFMTVSYWKDQGEIYLDRIDYTGNGGVSPTNYVKFQYQGRTDGTPMFNTGAPVVTASSLKTIEIGANGNKVRTCELSYQGSSSTGRSLLRSVQQFGHADDGTSASLPALIAEWQMPTLDLRNQTNWSPGESSWVNFRFIPGDFDGDGKADLFGYQADQYGRYTGYGALIIKYGGETLPYQVNWASNMGSWANCIFQISDYDGDGKSDIFGYQADPYGRYTGYGVLFIRYGGVTMPYQVNWSSGEPSWGSYRFTPGDFDGDGKTDLFGYQADQYGRYTGYGALIIRYGGVSMPYQVNWASNVTSWVNCIFQVGDFDGDGKTDLFGYQVDGSRRYTGYGALFIRYGGVNMPNQVNWASNVTAWSTYMFQLGDFNGDGQTDILGYLVDGVQRYGGGTMFIRYGGVNMPFQSNWASNVSSWLNCAFQVGDFDGDGKSDLLGYLADSAGRYTGNGAIFVRYGGLSLPSQVNWENNQTAWTTSIFQLGDFNGDGKSDIIGYLVDGSQRYIGSGVLFTRYGVTLAPDRLYTLTNGLGATTTLTYNPSSSYTNGLLPFVVQTVSSITTNDGNGTTSTINYTYSGGQYDPADREFRGFSYVKATDPAGTTSETWFKQDAVYKGLPYDQIVKDSAGNTYTRTVSSWLSSAPYTGVSFPYLSQRDDYLYDGTTTYKRITTEFTYDSYGNVTRKYNYGDAAVNGDERDENTEYSYDTANWIVSLPSHSYVLDPGGVKKAEGWFTYDTKGNLLTETRWLSGGANPVTTYTYDSYGNRTSVKDARNNTTTITYDTATQTYPATITNTLGHAATKTYDYRYGKPLTETDPNGSTTTYAYDVFGRVTKVTNPLDSGSYYGTVSYYYLDFGTVGSQRIRAYHTEKNSTTDLWWEETYFDGLGRTFRTRKEGPDNKVIGTLATYNSRGGLNGKRPPFFEGLDAERWTGFHYDAVGRLIMVVNPDGTSTTTAYDKGRTTITNANGQKKVEEKDVYGRLIKVEEYNGSAVYATTTYQYDTLGNLTGTTDAKGNQTTIAYDTLGRKTGMTDPDMGSWTYAYDAGGNLTSQTDAKGQAITFTYDAFNRVTKKDYPAGTDAVYTYDETTSTNSKGRLTTLADASGTSKYWYDALGRTTKNTRTIDGVAYTTQTQYDALSRPIIVWYPDGETVNYGFDTGGNLSQVGSYAMYTNYNAFGQVGTVSYGNGVSTTYQYQTTNNRLSNLTIGSPTQTLMSIVHYYDNVGNITAISDFLNSGRNQSFTYDSLNRLTQAYSNMYGTLSYGYNEIGNMTVKEGVSYTYPTFGPRPHAVTATSDGKAYVYDNNGNMTTDGLRTIAYDYDNMPSSVTMGATTTSFVYDASGQRVKKVTPTTTTVYVGKLYECTVGGSCTKYIMANGNKLAWKNGTGTYYYHQDHLGSSRVITDATGTKAEELTYLPYGATLTDSGNGTVTVEHRFTSQEYDAETGLYYYGARYYNPALGRFISADSIVPSPRDPQALNRYSYVRNNPIIYVDPTGHSWLSKGLKSVGKALDKAGHWIDDYKVQIAVTAAIVAVGVYAGGFVGEAIAHAAVPGGIGPPTAAWAAAGQIGGGITSGAIIGGGTAGVFGGDIGKGALVGGFAGGMFGSASFVTAGASPVVQIGAKAAAGGLVSKAAGGRFETGFMYTAAAATAYWGYTQMAGYAPTLAQGGDLENGAYKPNEYGQTPQGYKVFGLNRPLSGNFWEDFGKQAGTVKYMTYLPGMNAVAGLHDYWMNNVPWSLVTNVGTMLPAAAMSYGAQFGGQLAPLTVEQAAHDSQ